MILQRVLSTKTNKNIFWLLSEKGAQFIITLTVTSLVARYLGQEDYGKWTYLLMLISLMQIFVSLGLPNIVINLLLKNEKREELILSSAFLIGTAMGWSTFLIVLGIHLFYDSMLTLMLLIMSIPFLLDGCKNFDSYFQSQLDSKFSVISRVTSFSLSGALKLFIVFGKLNFFLLSITYAIEMFGNAILYTWFFLKKGKSLRFDIDVQIIKKLLYPSLFLTLSSFSAWLYLRVDQFMIKEMLGFETLGEYSAAVKISEILYFIPTVVVGTFYPRLVKSKEAGEVEFQFTLINVIRLLNVLGIAFGFVLFFGSELIIRVLFGQEFAGSSYILQVHGWSVIFVSFGLIKTRWLIINDLVMLEFLSKLFGAAVNIGLNLIFIPRYGGIGAAWSTLFSYAFAHFVSNLLFRRSRKLFWAQLISFKPSMSFIKFLK